MVALAKCCNGSHLSSVAAALKRGRIVSEAERQHIERYAAMLEAGRDGGAELDAIWQLLAT